MERFVSYSRNDWVLRPALSYRFNERPNDPVSAQPNTSDAHGC